VVTGVDAVPMAAGASTYSTWSGRDQDRVSATTQDVPGASWLSALAVQSVAEVPPKSNAERDNLVHRRLLHF
jgi:hypothetical protein